MTTHIAKFSGGPMDGSSFESSDHIEKVVIQLTDGTILRYEKDAIEAGDGRIEHNLVLTQDADEFDAEIQHDYDQKIALDLELAGIDMKEPNERLRRMVDDARKNRGEQA